jgi:four helix bundle protein
MQKEEFLKRTRLFGLRAIRLVESLPKTPTSRVLGRQLLRAATSVGANYRAAVRGKSRADFISKMGTVEEECDESIYWMEVLVDAGAVKAALVTELLDEGNQILSIVVASIKTARRRGK